MMLILVILYFHFARNTWKLAGVWDVPWLDWRLFADYAWTDVDLHVILSC